MDEDRQALRGWLLSTFLPGEPESTLLDGVSLRDQGVLDSMGRIRLVAFLEEQFGVEVERQDMRSGAFDTVDEILAFVARKRG